MEIWLLWESRVALRVQETFHYLGVKLPGIMQESQAYFLQSPDFTRVVLEALEHAAANISSIHQTVLNLSWDRARMWFVTIVKSRYLNPMLKFLWVYTPNALSGKFLFQPFFLCKITTCQRTLTILKRIKAKRCMSTYKDITFHLIHLEEDHLVPILGFVSQLKMQELYLEDGFSTERERGRAQLR